MSDTLKKERDQLRDVKATITHEKAELTKTHLREGMQEEGMEKDRVAANNQSAIEIAALKYTLANWEETEKEEKWAPCNSLFNHIPSKFNCQLGERN